MNAELLKIAYQFHCPDYIRGNYRRFEHLSSLNLPLTNASVLEIGAAIGDHSMYYLDRGCSVTAVEPRAENCLVYQQFITRLIDQENHAERVRLINTDAESFQLKVKGRFDIVHCYGLLYHLEDPETVLKNMAAHCQGLFLLETRVSFGQHEALNPIDEDPNVIMYSYHGPGCRPTRPWLLARLRELYPFVYLPITQPAHYEFPLDWSQPPPASEPDPTYRAIFIGSRFELDNPLLLQELPMQQRRA